MVSTAWLIARPSSPWPFTGVIGLLPLIRQGMVEGTVGPVPDNPASLIGVLNLTGGAVDMVNNPRLDVPESEGYDEAAKPAADADKRSS